MKILKRTALHLFMLTGMLASCSPDSDEVTPSASSGQDAKGKPVATTKADLKLSLTFSNSPATVGAAVTVFAEVIPNPGEGTIRIQRAKDATGNYTTVSLAADWVTIEEESVTTTDNLADYTYTPDATGMYGFRAQYVPKGGSGYGAQMSTANLEVVQACTEKLSLMGEAKATLISGNLYSIEVIYTVAACENLEDLKLQGGITAHSAFGTTSPTTASIRETGKGNAVVTWEGINITGGATKTYKVTFEKELKTAGTHTVTGDWSVKGYDASGNIVEGHKEALTVTN